MKIDVEHYELSVFKGSLTVLEKLSRTQLKVVTPRLS